MPRVKRGAHRRQKRKKLLKRAKGYYATKSKLYQAAQEAVDKALNYAYAGRRRKKPPKSPAAQERPRSEAGRRSRRTGRGAARHTVGRLLCAPGGGGCRCTERAGALPATGTVGRVLEGGRSGGAHGDEHQATS